MKFSYKKQLWAFSFSSKRWSLIKTTGDIPKDTVASHSGKNLAFQK